MFSFIPVITLAELVFCIINDFILTRTVGRPVTTQDIGEYPTCGKAIIFFVPALLNPIRALRSEGEDL